MGVAFPRSRCVFRRDYFSTDTRSNERLTRHSSRANGVRRISADLEAFPRILHRELGAEQT